RKFDFTAVRDPNFIHGRFSGIVEFQNIQARFLDMLHVFAQALKQNKALIAGSASVRSNPTTGAKRPSDVVNNPLLATPR
ncbi:hypothetical protein HDU93_007702, partial [Gonapodya sp. JEL0774]